MNKSGTSFISDYYSSLTSEFTGYLEKVEGKYAFEDIHFLRIKLKRMKAVYNLLEFIYRDDFKKKKYYRHLKPVFSALGSIRERQMNMDILSGYEGVGKLQNAYSLFIASAMPFLEKKLEKVLSRFDSKAFISKGKQLTELCIGLGEEELRSASSEFIRSETQRVRNLLSNSDDPEYLHKIRKVLKNISPVLLLLWPRDDKRFKKKWYRNLKTTEKHIGHWHDRYVLLESLTGFINASGRKGDKVYSEYLNLKQILDNEIYEDSKRMLKSLDNSLAELAYV